MVLLSVKHWQLLIVTLLLVLDYVLRHTGSIVGSGGDLTEAVLIAVIMVLAMSAAGVSRASWIAHIGIAAAGIAIAAAGVIASSDGLTTTGNVIGGYMLTFATILVLWVTVRRQHVSGDTLFGAMAVYMSIGVLFGIAYTVISRGILGPSNPRR